jgi:hypothetical protein
MYLCIYIYICTCSKMISYINFAILHLYLYCEWIASCMSSCHKPVDICTLRKVNFSCLCLKYCVVIKKALTPWGSQWDLFKHSGGVFWFGAWPCLLIKNTEKESRNWMLMYHMWTKISVLQRGSYVHLTCVQTYTRLNQVCVPCRTDCCVQWM